jgi:hypothetical protein
MKLAAFVSLFVLLLVATLCSGSNGSPRSLGSSGGSGGRPQCPQAAIIPAADIQYHDLQSIGTSSVNITACNELCCATSGCVAFSTIASTPYGLGSCSPGQPCCYLKNSRGELSASTSAGQSVGILPADNCADSVSTGPGYDLPGDDLQQVAIGSANVKRCTRECCTTMGCAAFVVLAKAPSDQGGCTAGAPCCYLKSAVGDLTASSAKGIVAGVINRKQK